MSHCTDQQVYLDFVLLFNGLQQIFVLQKLRNKQTNKPPPELEDTLKAQELNKINKININNSIFGAQGDLGRPFDF